MILYKAVIILSTSSPQRNGASQDMSDVDVLATVSSVQTFQRLGDVFPPDQTDFLDGQLFDVRREVHIPVRGSEATNGVPKFHFQSRL